MKGLFYLVASILLVFACFSTAHAKEQAMNVASKENARRTALLIGNSVNDDVTNMVNPAAGSGPPPDAKRIGDYDENSVLHWVNVPVTNTYNPFAKAKREVSKLIAVTNSLGMKFVFIPPGTFAMGSPLGEPGRENDETRHQVTLTQGFYMQTTEVTQGQWRAVMEKNSSDFFNCGEDCPVENVSWNDTQEFIQKLNQKEGRTYRLPTEAEWEYAARAGTTTPFNTGNCLSTDQANYDGNYPLAGCPYGQFRGKTMPVMSFAPNTWGLYDMHGNVWEWCEDRKGDSPSGAVTDPTGSSSSSSRVLRGGGWDGYARFCRSANRGSDDPANWFRDAGFRLVLLPAR